MKQKKKKKHVTRGGQNLLKFSLSTSKGRDIEFSDSESDCEAVSPAIEKERARSTATEEEK